MLSRLEFLPQEFLVRLAKAIEENIQDQFDRETNPYLDPWQPLAIDTIIRRSVKGTGSKILQDSGQMLRSLRVTPIAGTIEMKMDAPAGSHQSGGERLPVRTIFPDDGWPVHWVSDAQDIFEDIVNGV